MVTVTRATGNFWAVELKGSHGRDKEIQPITREGEVDVGITLGLIQSSGGNENRGVAAADEAGMEKEA